MKLSFISDTHSLHHEMPALGSGDVLVHCGDFTGYGTLAETEDFAEFIDAQDFKHKVVIAGNHDWCFENEAREAAEECMRDYGLVYLNDSGVELEGIKFWGSPIQPKFFNWAFQRDRGADIRRHWELIPADTDVLLTHGPLFGILDLCDHGGYAGCEDLLEIVQRIRPAIHAFGHIHEAYGQLRQEGTLFLNACILDLHYEVKNPPIEVDL